MSHTFTKKLRQQRFFLLIAALFILCLLALGCVGLSVFVLDRVNDWSSLQESAAFYYVTGQLIAATLFFFAGIIWVKRAALAQPVLASSRSWIDCCGGARSHSPNTDSRPRCDRRFCDERAYGPPISAGSTNRCRGRPSSASSDRSRSRVLR